MTRYLLGRPLFETSPLIWTRLPVKFMTTCPPFLTFFAAQPPRLASYIMHQTLAPVCGKFIFPGPRKCPSRSASQIPLGNNRPGLEKSAVEWIRNLLPFDTVFERIFGLTGRIRRSYIGPILHLWKGENRLWAMRLAGWRSQVWERPYRRVYQSQDSILKSKKTFDTHQCRPSSVIRENKTANAYKVKWKSPYAGLGLGADVKPSSFQGSAVWNMDLSQCQDPRSIFGSDHQRLI
jgi:hypothetical protein